MDGRIEVEFVMKRSPRFHKIGSFAASVVALVVCSGALRAATPSESGSRLQNISARAQIRSGENVLIGGLIIRGAQPKQVLVRGTGASLEIGGLPFPGRLANPTLEVYAAGNSVPIATNDNWTDTQRIQIAATNFAPKSELDPAILLQLPPGDYTAIMRGKNGTVGIGLVEVFEVDQTADPKLANLSARGVVEGGDNVLIGGLVVRPVGAAAAVGEKADPELIAVVRAIGPSLATYGIQNPVSDPTLELYDGNGFVLASNDDWREGPFLDVERSNLAPSDEREAVILAPLPPGNYTAIMRAKNQVTGTGLIEIYDAPQLIPIGN